MRYRTHQAEDQERTFDIAWTSSENIGTAEVLGKFQSYHSLTKKFGIKKNIKEKK